VIYKMIFGIKDAADLILVNKRTGNIDLYIDYANATSSEFTSESVSATAKGVTAIIWDGNRSGTLTLDAEVFDINLIPLLLGSEIKSGKSDIMQREDAELDASLAIRLEGDGYSIKPETVSIFKLNSLHDPSHVGAPLHNDSKAALNLPAQVKDVAVSMTDTTARITFPRVADAKGYIVLRNGTEVADTQSNEYTDTGVTAEIEYAYTVRAYNDFGRGPLSAEVDATASASGVTTPVTFTATSAKKLASAGNTGEVNSPDVDEVTFSLVNGVVQFTNALPGEAYAVYYMEETDNVQTFEISADKFADNYEIFATSMMKERDTGRNELIQIHYLNAKPQSNLSLTMSANEPTNFNVVFDLIPVGGKLGDFHILP